MYKILIRPLEKRDALTSWKWRNDNEIWKFTGSKPDILVNQEIETNWIERALKDSTSRRFAITVDDEYIGNIQLTNITSKDAEFHIFIGNKNYWGKGISFSATQQIIRYANNFLKLESLYLFVKPNNKAAIKLYERTGFIKVSDEIKMTLSLNETIKPNVSIFCMVYNHEQYIIDCIKGFLMQKCLFDFEIVIGEDYSTDNSRANILDFAHNYPGKFKLLFHNKNIGALENQNIVLKNCTGKYIALCEGDDYWIDPYKLQKQVDFLEANPDYSIHSGLAITSDQKTIGNKNKSTFRLQDFYTKNNLISCTILFRNTPLQSKWFNNVTFGDWMLYVYILKYLKNSKAYCDNHVLSFYRIHEGGIMQTLNDKSKFELAHIEHILKIKKLTNCKFSENDISTINNYCISLFNHYLKEKNNKLFKTTIINLILSRKKFPLKSYLYYLYNFIKFKS